MTSEIPSMPNEFQLINTTLMSVTLLQHRLHYFRMWGLYGRNTPQYCFIPPPPLATLQGHIRARFYCL